MSIGLIGKKIGMTREFFESGISIPVTVLSIEKGRILDVITKEKRGYDAIRVGFGKIKTSKLTKQMKGVFAKKNIGGTSGLLEGNFAQLGTQAWGIVATILWCAIASAIILKVIDLTIGIKVDKETERDGLDLRLHGETIQ